MTKELPFKWKDKNTCMLVTSQMRALYCAHCGESNPGSTQGKQSHVLGDLSISRNHFTGTNTRHQHLTILNLSSMPTPQRVKNTHPGSFSSTRYDEHAALARHSASVIVPQSNTQPQLDTVPQSGLNHVHTGLVCPCLAGSGLATRQWYFQSVSELVLSIFIRAGTINLYQSWWLPVLTAYWLLLCT